MTATCCPAEFADLEPFADWALPTEAERYAKRLASTMDELQAFYDAAFPRLEAATAYLEHLELDGLPERRHAPAVAVLLAGERVVPGRGVAPATGARQRRRPAWTWSSNRPSDDSVSRTRRSPSMEQPFFPAVAVRFAP